MEGGYSPQSDDIDVNDLRADLVAAAERRARELQSSSIDDEKRHAQERVIRQNFRRMIDPGILRPNSEEAALGSIKTLYTISSNLLRESDNPKYGQFKPTNSLIKKHLVEVKGALEYAVALGFRAEVENFQPLYVFNKHKQRELRIGNEILKEHIDRETERTERILRAKAEEKAAKEAAARSVMLAYEEDRRDKAFKDQREKAVREARVAAGLPPTSSPTVVSTSSPPGSRRVRVRHMHMPGSGMTLDGREIGQDDADPGSPPPYHDDEDAEGDEDDDE